MTYSLAQLIGDQSLMKVLKAFLRTTRPRYLRELSAVCEISPGGISDILRRLDEIGVLKATREGNRKCYVLMLGDQERRVFGELFSLYEKEKLLERAARYSKRAQSRLESMDETYAFYKRVKGKEL